MVHNFWHPFWQYLPRGTKICGTQKLQKIQVKCWKKVQKESKMVSTIFQPLHMLTNNICNIFQFSRFILLAVLYALQILFFLTILWKLVLLTGSYKNQNKKALKIKIASLVIVWGRKKKLTLFWAVFEPFFGISPDFFAIVQKAPILHF